MYKRIVSRAVLAGSLAIAAVAIAAIAGFDDEHAFNPNIDPKHQVTGNPPLRSTQEIRTASTSW